MTEGEPNDPTRGPLPLPTTFGGVAALARTYPRLLSVWQLLLAITAAVVVVVGLRQTWVESLVTAAVSLPEEGGSIAAGQLRWTGPAPQVLSRSIFLHVTVDPAGGRETGGASDAALSLESSGLGLRSLWGWATLPYPQELDLPLRRFEVMALLETWTAPVLLVTGLLVVSGLGLSWFGLATLYSIPLRLLGRALQRIISLREAWRLAAAALLPGALAMTAGLALYAAQQISLVSLIWVFPLHLVVGVVFALGGLRHFPRGQSTSSPFAPPAPLPEPAPATPARPAGNPFRAP